jgi:hypothetical protein
LLTFPLAIWGLLGYSLKGVEKQLVSSHLTALQAEIVLIQLRRSALEFQRATEPEKVDVIKKWVELTASMAKK